MKARPADALARPALADLPPGPTRARTTTRVTLDLAEDDYRHLRLWCVDASADASVLLRSLLDLARHDPVTRARAEATAAATMRARRGGEG